jgi:phosphoribosyl 1,2-cyclic phosphate phosphodiesterase
MKSLEPKSIEILKGIKTWIVDAAGYNQEHNPVHATLKEIYALNEQIKAQRVILTSLSLGMDYQTLLKELPKGYEPAYDGLIIE